MTSSTATAGSGARPRSGPSSKKAGSARGVTRSELEDRFLAFLDARGLPRPEVNVLVQGIEVDCLWREQRVVVELDGHASHATRATFESDRARDRMLAVAGHSVVRVTWRHLHQEADCLDEDLRALLKLPGAASA